MQNLEATTSHSDAKHQVLTYELLSVRSKTFTAPISKVTVTHSQARKRARSQVSALPSGVPQSSFTSAPSSSTRIQKDAAEGSMLEMIGRGQSEFFHSARELPPTETVSSLVRPGGDQHAARRCTPRNIQSLSRRSAILYHVVVGNPRACMP